MNTDTATIGSLVAAYRQNEGIVQAANLHGLWPAAGNEAVEIGGTYGDGPEGLARAVALSSNTGAPLDLLLAEVKAVAAWNRIRAIGESMGLPFTVALDWTDALVLAK